MKTTLIYLLTLLLTVSMVTGANNDDKPLKGKWDFNLKKIWETDSPGPDVFGAIQNLGTSADGRTFVLDSKNFKIFMFAPSGKYLGSFGRKGEGPGEFKALNGGDQLFVVGETLIVVDRGRLHYFSLDGKFKRTSAILPTLTPRAFIDENTFISAPASFRGPKGRKAQIKILDVKTKEEKVITEFLPFDKSTDTQEDGGRRVTVGIIIGNITPLMMVEYWNGTLYYGMSSSYAINTLKLKDNQKNSFSVKDRKPKNVSTKFLDQLKQGLKDVPPKMLDNILNGLPKKASFFQEIVIGRQGGIYVFISDPGNNTNQAVDIFSPHGKYLYRAEIKAPEGETIDSLALSGDFLTMSTEDEEGNIKVTQYAVSLPVFK